MKSTVRRFSMLLGAICFMGCGSEPKLQPVTGKVTVEGRPASGAQLMFYVDGPPSIAVTPATATADGAGAFSMATGIRGGVAPGKYLVTVVWPDPSIRFTDAQKMMGASPSDAPDLLKGRYATRDGSKLAVEIKLGANALEPFDLK